MALEAPRVEIITQDSDKTAFGSNYAQSCSRLTNVAVKFTNSHEIYKIREIRVIRVKKVLTFLSMFPVKNALSERSREFFSTCPERAFPLVFSRRLHNHRLIQQIMPVKLGTFLELFVLFHLFDAIHNRCMIAPAQYFADLGQRDLVHITQKVHR